MVTISDQTYQILSAPVNKPFFQIMHLKSQIKEWIESLMSINGKLWKIPPSK